MLPVFEAVYRDAVSLRVESGLVLRVVVFFPALQFPVPNRIQNPRVAQLFNVHQLVVLVQIPFQVQVAVLAVFPGYSAVSVRTPASLSFAGKIILFDDLLPHVLQSLNAADPLVVIPQRPVGVVPHALLVSAGPVAVQRVTPPFRSRNPLTVRSVVVHGGFGVHAEFLDHRRVSGLGVVAGVPLFVQIGCPALYRAYIVVLQPGIPVRPHCKLVLRIVPAVARNQVILSVFGVFNHPVQIHRVPVLVVLPRNLLVAPLALGHLRRIPFRPVHQVPVLVEIALLFQHPAAVYLFDPCISLRAVDQIALRIQQFDPGHKSARPVCIMDTGISLVVRDNGFPCVIDIRLLDKKAFQLILRLNPQIGTDLSAGCYAAQQNNCNRH